MTALGSIVVAVMLSAGGPSLRVASLGLSGSGLEEDKVAFMSEHLAQQLGLQPEISCITRKDVDVVLGLERQRQLMGCSETTSCVAEIANALGADAVISGSVGQFGTLTQLNVKLISPRGGETLASFSAQASDAQSTLRALTMAARKLGNALRAQLRPNVPRVDENVPANSLSTWFWVPAAGAGAGAVLGGVLFGLALSDQQQLQQAAAAGANATLTGQQALEVRDRGTQRSVGAVVSFAVAGAMAAASIGMLALNAGSGQITVVGALDVQGGGIAVAGRF